MHERTKAALAEKIDSKEKFDAFLRDHNIHANRGSYYSVASYSRYPFPLFTEDLQFRATADVPAAYWWWVRETMRDWFGVYRPAEDSTVLTALMKIRTIQPHLPHISMEDPHRIAVTMSPEDGARDKQTIIALGRWLRRMFPAMPDATIQTVEATHRADLSDELEIVRTAAEIEAVYTGMRGDTGCMRHDKSYWGLEHHPSVVYSSPGFGVAVVRNTEGEVVARSVVYENPEDASDKRYVRIYGDLSLKRRLERNGYRLAGTGDTVVDAYPADGEGSAYIMPYLDIPGGAGSGCGDHAPAAVAVQDGKIHILSHDAYTRTRRAIEARHLAVSNFLASTSTAAKVSIRPLPEDLFQFRCALTGQLHDSSKVTPVEVWHNDDIVSAHPDAAADYVEAWVRFSHKSLKVRCAPGTPMFEYQLRIWIDTPETREHCNLVRLDAELYPENRDWHAAGDTRVLEDGRRVLRKDAVVLQVASSVEYRLKSEINSTWVRLHRSSRFPDDVIYALPDAPHGVTRSGTKVGANTHDVVRLYDGSLEFSRNVMVKALYAGGTAKVHKDTPLPEIKRLSIEAVTRSVEVWIGEWAVELPDHPNLARMVRSITRAGYVRYDDNGRSVLSHIDAMEQPVHQTLRALEIARRSLTDGTVAADTLDVQIHALRLMRDRLDALAASLTPPTVETDDERFVVAA